jgi:hypothetical protein
LGCAKSTRRAQGFGELYEPLVTGGGFHDDIERTEFREPTGDARFIAAFQPLPR